MCVLIIAKHAETDFSPSLYKTVPLPSRVGALSGPRWRPYTNVKLQMLNLWLPERPESARARAAAGPLTPPGNRRQVRMLCLRAKCVPLVLAVQSAVALCP